MNKNITHKIPRAALTLLMMLAMSLTASATDFITDVMVAGHSNQSQFNTLIQNLQQQGWTDINQDLNQGCGSSSYYIHLLYKTQNSSGNTGVPITDFYIRTGANPPDNLTYGGRTYYLVPCQGNDNFVNGHGDLNAGCGSSSDYIFLYYTKDALSNNTGVTAITFNTTQSGAVGANGGSTGYDLNSGAGGAYIYMHLTTTTGANVVTLSSGSGNVPLRNGHILTGTGGTETQVTIADGATVTFNGVNNTAIPDNSSHPWPGISCLGNATIVLNGSTTNSVKGGRGGSGIHVAANKTLTIQGSGTLNATGGYRSAGIGGGWGNSCGNIVISGGTITANGDDGAAGIGSGWQSSCGNITISGGTITATGGTSAAGIGSGYYNSSCGNITITNGVTRVTATKGQGSNNAVGAGNSSTCGTITIGGVQTGNITMSPFVTYPYTVVFDANGSTGTMNNQSFMYNVAQNLTANAFNNAGHPFLGWATTANGNVAYTNGQSVTNLTQTAGATVTLYAKWGNTVTLTSQIGEVLLQDGDTLTGTGGQNTRVKIADGATVTFNDVDITNINSSNLWPGISCLGNAVIVLNGGTTNSVKGGNLNSGIHVPQGKTLTIQGSGTLNATGGITAAGIGSGPNSTCGNIIISGGIVTAIGGQYAAGIGSGRNDSTCGNITISGGIVTATGGDRAPGIGSGYSQSSCGNITITNGVTSVTATKGSSSPNAIGAGDNSTCGTVTIGDVQTGNITMSPFVTYPYTVAFDSNGGTGSMANQVFMYNVAQNLTANAFSNMGRQFIGWATTANGNVAYTNGQSVINLTSTYGATVTLYAKWGNTVTLTSQIGEVLLQNGDILTGTGGQNTRVKIADGATVTFNGVNNTAIASDINHKWPGINCLGDAVIVLNGGTTNSVKGGFQNSGIHVAANKTLTIQGSGTLNATGGIYAAGIGSGYNNSSCGNITISGGIVTATGGDRAPGIGSGHYQSSCGNITITNGVTSVTATKGSSTPNAIGAGDGSTCGTVTIGGVQTGNITMSPFVTYPYTVAFDSNGGTGSMADMNFMYNFAQSLTANSFTNWGYSFDGWATSPNGPKVYNDGQSVSNLAQNSGDAVTLYAKWNIGNIESIDYIDGDSIMHTCNNFTVLTGNETTLGAGWYVVASDITYNSTLTLYDDVNLILCNGMTMTITSTSGNGINGHQSNLTLYSQSLDSIAGTLNVTINDLYRAINLSNYIQHSGNVVVNNSDGDAIYAGNITMNGGSIHATSGAYGIYAFDNMTVNGGSVNANGYTCGISVGDNGIITLGWTNESDRIRASSYYGTVTVATGQAFIDEAGQWYLNTLTESQKTAIAGQTLSPFTDFDMSFTITYITNGGTLPDNYPTTYTFAETITLPIPIKEDMEGVVFKGWYDNATFEGDPIFEIAAGTALGDKTFYARWRLEYTDVTYLDADGQTQTVHARVLYGDETSLDGGCYTLIDTVSCNHTLSFGGNTTLIIPDNLYLGFSEGYSSVEGNGITVEGDFAIYGQTGREGYIRINTSGAAVYATGDVTVGNVGFSDPYFDNGIHYSILSGGDIFIVGSQCNTYGNLSGGDILIAGSRFYSSGTINANNGNGTINLSWTAPNNYIEVDEYNGTVVLAKAFRAYDYDEESYIIIPAGTVSDNATINNKVLYPYAETIDINYIDEYGETHTVTAQVLCGNETGLDGGCYTLIGRTLYNHTLSFDGNTTLIVPDYSSLYIDGVEGSGITVEGNLAIYGQTGRYGLIYINVSEDAVYATGDITVSNVCFSNYSSDDYGTLRGGDILIAGGHFSAGLLCSDSGNGTITLGYLDEDDQIYCDGYEGVVVVREGQTLKDDWNDNTFSGTLTAEEIAYIAGKPLVPYIEPTVTQMIALSQGWNWVSLYVEFEDAEQALQAFEAALGGHGLKISSVDDFTTYADGEWGAMGDLEEMTNDLMYMVLVDEDMDVTLEGMPSNPADYSITINPGWTWIGFPSPEAIAIEDAFADFEAEDGDKIMGVDDFTTYAGEWGAMGDLDELTPGTGYMYFSNSTQQKTLVFSTTAKGKNGNYKHIKTK